MNNDAFLDWTTDDWADSYEAQNNVNATEPILDWRMKDVYISAPNGSNGKNLRTVDMVNSAIDALYWFRQNNGLEDDVDYNEVSIPYFYVGDDWRYQECSDSTKQLADIYGGYAQKNSWDYRHIRYYPLIDRVIDWCNSTYPN